MSRATAFEKVQGLGNDFILIDRDDLPGPELLDVDWARQICDRRRGIGADGVLICEAPSATSRARWRMHIINADGSVPEMCGNGLRCFAHWLLATGREADHAFRVETLAGELKCTVAQEEVDGLDHQAGGLLAVRARVSIEMGVAVFDRHRVPMTGSDATSRAWFDPSLDDFVSASTPDALEFRGVSMGNPHAVCFVDSPVTRAFAERFGARISNHALFPQRTNVEFAYVRDDGSVEVSVYERGCGLTLACGTGAAATAAVLVERQPRRRGTALRIDLPGGQLGICVPSEVDKSIVLSGPAQRVFRGQMELPGASKTQ